VSLEKGVRSKNLLIVNFLKNANLAFFALKIQSTPHAVLGVKVKLKI